LEKNNGYNGEMGDAWNSVNPSISSCANVFAIPMSNHGTLPFPKALWTWGEESGCTRHVRLEGEHVKKVVVDRGAWGEYDDNPIYVRDLRHIMIDVRRFTGQVFTAYAMHTLVGITFVHTAMVGGMIFDVFNPKTGLKTYSYYRWGESTNLICFAVSNNSLIKTPQAASDILLLSWESPQRGCPKMLHLDRTLDLSKDMSFPVLDVSRT